ncbi:MAG: oligopeptide transporter, OPT family [Bacteroidetes bacterium]|nr:oligopeptide transporter, OPT family [Bacteroidota bacterium]MCW5895937.1 oligopeptide transporter, OPT family [Bacteroidota bacterium]
MEHHSTTTSGLPENAYKVLKPGEEYRPIMDPTGTPPEVTPWSLFWGLIMAVLFSAAAAYSGLKIGQVFEAAIPIAILAVGLSSLAKTRGALGQNVIIQSIGASSGVIVAGAIFTIPALYILDLPVDFFKIFFASALGGSLGVLFLIPFRKYFVKDMHGKFPFPEATATTEILVAGEKGGKQAGVLVVAGLIGGFFDFMFSAFGLWAETITSRMFDAGAMVADKFKMVFKLNVSAMIFGLGYIVGLKYSAIIAAGSFLSWFILVPLFSEIGSSLTIPLGATADKLISQMSAEEIFRNYVRQIGIGGIAMAGIIGVIRSSKIIAGAFKLAVKEMFGERGGNDNNSVRWQTDIKMSFVVMAIILTALMIFVFFYAGVVFNLTHAFVGLLIVLIISFLFTTVAANAIAIVGTNPISGMTLMTLILSSYILVSVGLSGTEGMVSALIIGGVVCTALSMAGGFITDLKIGYWLGSTPKKQEQFKFLGILVSAATVGGVIYILNETYGFKGPNAMVAPQANAMAAVIQPLMSNTPAPWVLYLVGACISLILLMVNVSPLAFALGMYIPQDLNTPLLFGGLVAWYVSTRTKDEKKNNARSQRGTLIASGLIAGGSLFGVLNALLRFGGLDVYNAHWAESNSAEILGLFMFLFLAAYVIMDSMRAKEE